MKQSTLRRTLADYQQLTAQIAALEKQRDTLAERIKVHMGDAQELQVGDTVIRHKPVTSSRFDSKAFATAYEGLYHQFCKATTVKRFTVTA